MALERVTVQVHADGSARASEIVADLRNAAESLFHPMRLVAYWDEQEGGRHTCPQEEQGQSCLHRLSPDDPDYVPFSATVEREMSGEMEVVFPHAGVTIYLGPPLTLADAVRQSRARKS